MIEQCVFFLDHQAKRAAVPFIGNRFELLSNENRRLDQLLLEGEIRRETSQVTTRVSPFPRVKTNG